MTKSRTTHARSNAGEGPSSQPPAPAPLPPSPDNVPAINDQPGDLAPAPVIDAQDFESEFGEPLDRTLDLDTWTDGRDFSGIFERLDEEVSSALTQEDSLRVQVRKVLLPMIATHRNAPKGAGVFGQPASSLKQRRLTSCLTGELRHATAPAPLTTRCRSRSHNSAFVSFRTTGHKAHGATGYSAAICAIAGKIHLKKRWNCSSGGSRERGSTRRARGTNSANSDDGAS
jgi:hypothetical protein